MLIDVGVVDAISIINSRVVAVVKADSVFTTLVVICYWRVCFLWVSY